MRAIGIILIVVGIVGLVYGGLSWTRREKVVDLGPLQVTSEHEKTLPVPPIVGGICLAAGVLLLVRGGRTAV